MKKEIYFDRRALREFKKLPKAAKERFDILFQELATFGSLREPDAKKMVGTSLFEVRVRVLGVWRSMFAYSRGKSVVVLSFFGKKSQKTPLKEIEKATNRLRDYR